MNFSNTPLLDQFAQTADPRLLQANLVSEAQTNLTFGELPDRHGPEIKRLFDTWLAPNVFVCQMATNPCQEYCGHRENRCGDAYWRNHSALVGRMMENLATSLGETATKRAIWQTTGLLHDLDYLRAPHDKPGHDEDESHPVPLVLDLRSRKFHPVLTLAILEHSPHLDLGMSSRLSAALIGCDEAATLTAFGVHIADIEGVPGAVASAVPAHKIAQPAQGKHRSNIRERMLAAFRRVVEPGMTFAVQI